MHRWIFSIASFLFALTACRDKVGLLREPLHFALAKPFWFEDESTFFLFYQLDNPQAFRPEGSLELSFDQGETWQDIGFWTYLHPHEEVDCGRQSLCGSLSIRWTEPIASVQLRYRYHRDAELAESQSIPVVSVHRTSPLRRSFSIYGVFDAMNAYVQWRGRHSFPGLSHEEAEALGLRRPYRITGIRAQVDSSEPDRINPSLYGTSSDCGGADLGPHTMGSEQGADSWLMVRVGPAFAQVCGWTEVMDGEGSYHAVAYGRKNPVVENIVQDLQLAFTKAEQVRLIFATCQAVSQDYLDYQVDRLHFTTNRIDYCMDQGNFNRETIVSFLYEKVLAARQNTGQDLALVLILHYNLRELSPVIVDVVGQSLAAIANGEQFPRVAAIFVYDSFPAVSSSGMTPTSLIWCPTEVQDGETSTLSSCAFQPSKFVLGPLEVRSAPVLPDYESFQEMDDAQKWGAKIDEFAIYTPREPDSGGRLTYVRANDLHYVFNPFDQLPILARESLSFCPLHDFAQVFAYQILTQRGIRGGSEAASSVSLLPMEHRLRNEDRVYNLGLRLQAPFLVSVRYTTSSAIGPKDFVSYISIRGQQSLTDELGEAALQNKPLPFRSVLTKCTRYCQHPAFDETGRYILNGPWYEEFATRCYQPQLPRPEGR
ncbi:hypothetical protein [Oligoflexus tunisiensis]|uniref:hypothetical protein n=1 Tax=Oligoflexus tunisiensis TaxID=708132 RepID=UPI00114D0BEA|nr:hypothetical protein [Oligoflexus tunisiensis]